MKQIYKYDNKMNYVPSENMIINDGEEIPEGYTDIPPVNPDGAGMYKPVFDKGKSEWRENSYTRIHRQLTASASRTIRARQA
ncbi:hypothetical protein [Bacillus subtilis]|uniref:hypothetical protein n=1 Tax=Bacillus subtilis TaxID=1423 RepID=UPI00330783C9